MAPCPSPQMDVDDGVTVVLRDSEGNNTSIALPLEDLKSSKFVATMLEGRWSCSPSQGKEVDSVGLEVTFPVQTGIPLEIYQIVLQQLGNPTLKGVLSSVPQALQILKVALQLLFEGGIQACLSYIEAVPWNKEEEEDVLHLIPLLELGPDGERVMARRQKASAAEVEQAFKRIVESSASTDSNSKMKKLRKIVEKGLSGQLLADLPLDRKQAALVDQFSKLNQLLVTTLQYHEMKSRIPTYVHGKSGAQYFNDAVDSLCWLTLQILDSGDVQTVYKWLTTEGRTFSFHIYQFSKDTHKTSNMIYGNIFLILHRVIEKIVEGVIIVPPQGRMELIVIWLSPLDASVLDDRLTAEVAHRLNFNIRKLISTLPLAECGKVLEDYQALKARSGGWLDLTAAYEDWFERLSIQE